MGILDKITDTLRKVTPKEIAPILPVAAMMIPGMQGLSPLMKFALPQLAAAAGSARTSGEINPFSQVAAGLGSLASVKPNSFGGELGKTKMYGTGPVQRAAELFNKVPGVDSFARGQESLASFLPGGQEAYFNKSMLGPLSAAGGIFSSDVIKAANAEFEKNEAADAAAASESSTVDNNLMAAIARMSDPFNRYGNNPNGNFNPVTGQLLNTGGRVGMNMGGGLMDTRAGYNMGGMGSIPQTPNVPQGMQLEGRGGGFIPMGAQEKKDDVPAMLAKNEFVMTADAVRAAGGGSVEKGAQKMYDVMNQLEAQV